jgi:serine/threonine protein kinase
VLMALKTFHDQTKQEAVIMMEAGIMDLQGLLRAQSYCAAAPLAIVLLQDVTRGLSYTHQCGIIHRDLKPSNVILCLSAHQGGSRLVARISDFGCSRLQSSRPTETLNFCTCLYRAPEVFELVQPVWFKSKSIVSVEPTIGSAIVDAETPGGPDLELVAESAQSKTSSSDKQDSNQRYTFAADVWSIGCIYAEFLHSRVLFQTTGNTDVSLLAAIAARIGIPEDDVLVIKGWPGARLLDLAKASSLAYTQLSYCARQLDP